LRSILSNQRNVEVLQDEVTGIDTRNRRVHLRQYKIPYDYLVLATGIQYNYFGHDEWRHVAPGLESLDDADLIRGKVLTAFERAEEVAALDRGDTAAIQQLLTFVLVGAGTMGVEMASTLAEMSRMALRTIFGTSIRGRHRFCCTRGRRASCLLFPKVSLPRRGGTLKAWA
jgi:NADH dehydrogenase FAD-containing subunit